MAQTIIFIHKGDSWYLPYALKQVKYTNIKNRIVLLGDVANAKYSKFVEYHPISSFYTSAEELEKRYVHLSTSRMEYERFCLSRWFVWRDFMKANDIQSAMLPDTDVLFFQDISNYIDGLNGHASLMKGKSNAMGFVYITLETLDRFCNFIMEQYTNREKLDVLKTIYEEWIAKGNPGGISDITLQILFIEEEQKIKANFQLVNSEIHPVNGNIFVHSYASDCFKHDLKLKRSSCDRRSFEDRVVRSIAQ